MLKWALLVLMLGDKFLFLLLRYSNPVGCFVNYLWIPSISHTDTDFEKPENTENEQRKQLIGPKYHKVWIDFAMFLIVFIA